MKQVILKKISLVNFKKIKECTIDFDREKTTISGRNGTGKTTLFDAFTWLLFGKSSDDRKQFNIKTLDEKGNVIPRLPHEVTAVVEVDGRDVTLTRRFTEKWTKKRGSATEEFTGNEEERLFNEVPCSLKEWNEKIAGICPENVFKFITNPKFFTAQKTDTQREMLFRMAGGVSDEEVAKGCKEFEELLSKLTGKTLEEYKKEIGAKKRRVKSELEGLPQRIDECKRSATEPEDWSMLENALAGEREKLSTIDKLMMDESAQMKKFIEKKKKKMNELSELRKKQGEVRSDIERKLLSSFYESSNTLTKMRTELDRLNNRADDMTNELKTIEESIPNMQSKLVELREEWRKVNAETISFRDEEFVCPTCKRPLEDEDAEAKKSELIANFNKNKADRLAELSAKGKHINEELKSAQTRAEWLVNELSGMGVTIAETSEEIKKLEALEKPETEKAVLSDADYVDLQKKIGKVEEEVNKDYTSTSQKQLEDEREEVQQAVEDIVSRLSKKEVVEGTNKRIAELESLMKSQTSELAMLEGAEFTIQQFSKKRTEAIENKINGLFSIVKFKLYEQQINGGEIETCEATVDGVPYCDLNSASKINAGLDIIQAICKSEDISAPIFVDNAESVTDLFPINSQIIKLIVSDKHEKLTVAKN